MSRMASVCPGGIRQTELDFGRVGCKIELDARN
jgi:hypothetical protein